MRKKETTLMRLLHALTFCKNKKGQWALEVMLWGDVGIGKSAYVELFALLRGFRHRPFVLSHIEPTDLAMLLPSERDGVKCMEYALHETLLDCLSDVFQILFLDEYTESTLPVQAVSMPLVLDRRIGGHTLSPTVIPILAANPHHIACGGNRLARPTANRITHLDLDRLFPAEETVDEWTTWLLQDAGETPVMQIIDPVKERARVSLLWDDAFMDAREKLAAFIECHPHMLQQKLEGAWRPTSIADLAFPTKRSVDKVGRILATATIHDLTESELLILIEGTVGTQWAHQFIGWLDNYEYLPDIDALLDGNADWEHDKYHHDRTMIVLTASFNKCANTKDPDQKENRIRNMWGIMSHIINTDKKAADIIVPTVAKMSGKGWLRDDYRKYSDDVCKKLSKVVAK